MRSPEVPASDFGSRDRLQLIRHRGAIGLDGGATGAGGEHLGLAVDVELFGPLPFLAVVDPFLALPSSSSRGL